MNVLSPIKIVLVDFPTADEIDAEFFMYERKIRTVPRKLGVVDVQELFHEHPDLVLALFQGNNWGFRAGRLDRVPAQLLTNLTRDVRTDIYPMY